MGATVAVTEETKYQLKVELLVGIVLQLTGAMISLQKIVITISSRAPLSHREGIDKELAEVSERLDKVLDRINEINKVGEQPNG